MKEMKRIGSNAFLGIELGSTRIKAVLIDENGKVLASGSHSWENRLENGLWTYDLSDVWTGIQSAYKNLNERIEKEYGEKLTTVRAMGFSAMMHGYLPFNEKGEQVCAFRTWRNTNTTEAAAKLLPVFDFNIPERWSIAHLYQAMLNGEKHVKDIAFITTLAGYVHYMVTGEKVLGIGDASGMFPIDSTMNDYDKSRMAIFDAMLKDGGYDFTLDNIFPKVLVAGESAGSLTKEGALLIDPTGTLQSGIPLCPPEGDAGTGMVATNSVKKLTGNVSAGTSVFAMIVLEKALKKVHREIDMVTTPAGNPVAMAHCNTCCSEIDAWVKMFKEMFDLSGANKTIDDIYALFYEQALNADVDAGKLLCYNYFAAEPIVDVDTGRPLLMRKPDAKFNFPNFARAQIYGAIAALKLGMDILFVDEGIACEKILGHGGLFTVKGVSQRFLAGALNVPVSVMETAGEGGPWGMALLASYMMNKQDGETLDAYLQNKIFSGAKEMTISPDENDVKGFTDYMKDYELGLAAERAAGAVK